MNETRDAVRLRTFQEEARALDVGREDLLPGIERQRGGAVDHEIDAGHGALDRGGVADVSLDRLDRAALGIVERRDVQRADLVPAREQEAHQIDRRGSPRHR